MTGRRATSNASLAGDSERAAGHQDADSPQAALNRLEAKPMFIPKVMLSSLNMIIIMARREYQGNASRKVTTCSEVKGLDSRGEIIVKTLVEWNPKTDNWRNFGDSYYLKKAAEVKGITLQEAKKEVSIRASLLDTLALHGVRSFNEVSKVIRDYIMTPEDLREKMSGALSPTWV